MRSPERNDPQIVRSPGPDDRAKLAVVAQDYRCVAIFVIPCGWDGQHRPTVEQRDGVDGVDAAILARSSIVRRRF
jgi:hypothetical protein